MKRNYPIMLADNIIGEAEMEQQGLCFFISCRCQLSGEVLYRVCVSCGERQENLGILVPDNGWFTAKSRVSVSKLGVGEYHFCVIPKHAPLDTDFVPLKPEEPFAYISRLDKAYLRKYNNALCLAFVDREDQSSATV